MPDNATFLGGIDLGGTKILSVCVDGELNPLDQDYRETEAEHGPDHVVGRMVQSMRAAAGGRRLSGIGISTPGPSDPKRGVVTTPPNLPGWHDVSLARLIGGELGVPAWIENDANAAAIAEHRLGAGRGTEHMILVTLGTGVGGGLILGGRIYRGASGAAGEIGHMRLVDDGPRCGCGGYGHLEALASGRALGERAAEIIDREPNGVLARMVRLSGEEPDARVLEAAAHAGDSSALEAIRTAGRHLGTGLTTLVNIFNPELIVVGGSLRKIADALYLDLAVDIMRRDAFAQSVADVRVTEAQLGDEAPALGAAIVALEMIQADPAGWGH